ncbi:hypothetical protein LTR56_020502 [Elasticomyces elasticus]|nr:hypothetical protein LTR22_024290 [Elasticomyces elasticus]KAK3625241.1 hypothetical protein LTR56_020502 [Elasticomyces elasticus]KAK4906184.1 hypothetical protein LTR49_024627 [Elasticomyces elasticus]KAK5744085.1 hypothetical protein LTS12_023619 [Elasticomyces elasticus]
MADFDPSDDTSSLSSLDEFDIDLIAAEEWDGNVEELDDLVAIVRGYVNRSDGGEELDYEIQSLCHSLSAHDLPPFHRAQLNTYLATSNEGMDEARLNIASTCIDQAIAESMDSSQDDQQTIQAWKKHIEHMYTLLVPAHEDTPADVNSGYDGAADTTNQALGHDGTTGAALSYYERTHPLALCGSRACRNESCRAPTPAPAPAPAAAAVRPISSIQPQSPSAFEYQAPSETSSSSHTHSRSHSHAHSHSDHGAPLSEEDKAAALEEARKRATAHIEELKKEMLATEDGKKASAATAERVEKKKETQRFAKAVPRSHRLKAKNAAYATGAETEGLARALSFRLKVGAARGTTQDALKAFERKEADDKAKQNQEHEEGKRGMDD